MLLLIFWWRRCKVFLVEFIDNQPTSAAIWALRLVQMMRGCCLYFAHRRVLLLRSSSLLAKTCAIQFLRLKVRRHFKRLLLATGSQSRFCLLALQQLLASHCESLFELLTRLLRRRSRESLLVLRGDLVFDDEPVAEQVRPDRKHRNRTCSRLGAMGMDLVFEFVRGVGARALGRSLRVELRPMICRRHCRSQKATSVNIATWRQLAARLLLLIHVDPQRCSSSSFLGHEGTFDLVDGVRVVFRDSC